MSRFLYKNRSSKSRKTSKESDDTISIHDEWLLEEEEKNKNNDNKNNKKNKKKKVKSSKYWPFSKVKGRGVSGSKTLLSILKDHTLDLSEVVIFIINDIIFVFPKLIIFFKIKIFFFIYIQLFKLLVLFKNLLLF